MDYSQFLNEGWSFGDQETSEVPQEVPQEDTWNATWNTLSTIAIVISVIVLFIFYIGTSERGEVKLINSMKKPDGTLRGPFFIFGVNILNFLGIPGFVANFMTPDDAVVPGIPVE